MIKWVETLDDWLTNPHEFGHLLGFTKLTSIHGEWIKIFLRAKGLDVLQAFRGGFKTTCGIVALVLLFLCKPEIRILITRKNIGMAADIVKTLQQIFETNGAIKLFIKARWNLDTAKTDIWSSEKTTFAFKKQVTVQPSLSAIGSGGAVTGQHYDYIWADDISTIEDRYSAAERVWTRRYWRELERVMEPSGARILTNTPWAEDDINAEIPPEIFEGRKFPFGSVQLPAEDMAAIEEIKRKSFAGILPLSEWYCNYELIHIADRDTLGVFPIVDTWDCDYCVAFIDPSFSDKKDSDSTSVAIVGVRSDGFIIFTGMNFQRSISDIQTRREIISFLDKFTPVETIYESQLAESSIFFIDALRETEAENRVKVKNYWTIKHQTRNKHERINATISAQRERIKMLTGTQSAFSIEISRYCKGAEHDDAPDALAGAIEALGTSPIIAEYAASLGILKEMRR